MGFGHSGECGGKALLTEKANGARVPRPLSGAHNGADMGGRCQSHLELWGCISTGQEAGDTTAKTVSLSHNLWLIRH